MDESTNSTVMKGDEEMRGHNKSGCSRSAIGMALVASTFAFATTTMGRPIQTPQPAPSPTVVAKAVDLGWPRVYRTASGASAVVHQPQVASWDEQKHLTALAAVAYSAADSTEPALGTIKLEADTSVAVAER